MIIFSKKPLNVTFFVRRPLKEFSNKMENKPKRNTEQLSAKVTKQVFSEKAKFDK